MMEAARTSETLVNFYQTTRCYNPEDSNLQAFGVFTSATLGALRQNIVHDSISETLSIVSGLPIDTNFSSRHRKRRKNQGKEEIDGELQFLMNIMEVINSLLI
jgi:hypothetical protein